MKKPISAKFRKGNRQIRLNPKQSVDKKNLQQSYWSTPDTSEYCIKHEYSKSQIGTACRCETNGVSKLKAVDSLITEQI